MNILPKKRWHVRTKDNIARVRRDEAAAREEEEKRRAKLELAESEARINFLRKQSGLPEKRSLPETTTSEPSDGISAFDLFADYKTHTKKTNKAHEKEQKETQEKYEKKIGYLTYLGQDTNEALKIRSWYEEPPKRAKLEKENSEEKDFQNKYNLDPLTLIKALLPPDKLIEKNEENESKALKTVPEKTEVKDNPCKEKTQHKKRIKHKEHKKKHKHHEKKHKKSKQKYQTDKTDYEKIRSVKIQKLRVERLHREAIERVRQAALLAPVEKPAQKPQEKRKKADPKASTERPKPMKQKYNSQFNPQFAKQNLD